MTPIQQMMLGAGGPSGPSGLASAYFDNNDERITWGASDDFVQSGVRNWSGRERSCAYDCRDDSTPMASHSQTDPRSSPSHPRRIVCRCLKTSRSQ